jgi:hypothetical protein
VLTLVVTHVVTHLKTLVPRQSRGVIMTGMYVAAILTGLILWATLGLLIPDDV